MATVITTQGLSLAPELRAHLLRRFTFALYRFENRISRSEVFIKDLSGGKNGLTKGVVARIELSGREAIVVEAVAHDHFVAVNLAARRCKRAVKRTLKQPLSRRRVGLRHLTTPGGGDPATGMA